jgi:hypothetical protein
VAVDSHAGTLTCYVDGVFCNKSQVKDKKDLVLQHKLVVLGGGKQAEARGGGVRRVMIHERPLSAQEIQALTTACQKDIRGKLNVIVINCSAGNKRSKALKPGQVAPHDPDNLFAPLEDVCVAIGEEQDSVYRLRRFQGPDADSALALMTRNPKRTHIFATIADLALPNDMRSEEDNKRLEEAFEASLAILSRARGAAPDLRLCCFSKSANENEDPKKLARLKAINCQVCCLCPSISFFLLDILEMNHFHAIGCQ